jgi:hypothetical protein
MTWFRPASALPDAGQSAIPSFDQHINGDHQSNANERHQPDAGDETGHRKHDHCADHWDHRLLSLAVHPVADRDRTPEHGGEKKFGIEKIHKFIENRLLTLFRPKLVLCFFVRTMRFAKLTPSTPAINMPDQRLNTTFAGLVPPYLFRVLMRNRVEFGGLFRKYSSDDGSPLRRP